MNHWQALRYYSTDGWAEIDNYIAEKALRVVNLGRKNYLFMGSDSDGDRAALMYTLIGSYNLNGVEPESYLRHVLATIADHPVNMINDLLLGASTSLLNSRQYGAGHSLTENWSCRGKFSPRRRFENLELPDQPIPIPGEDDIDGLQCWGVVT